MTTITFDSVELKNPSPLKPKEIYGSHFEVEIDCLTETFADVTAIIAKSGITKTTVLLSGKTSAQTTGTKGSLVITGGDLAGTYTNCAIMGEITYEELPGGTRWKYKVKFVKDYAA